MNMTVNDYASDKSCLDNVGCTMAGIAAILLVLYTVYSVLGESPVSTVRFARDSTIANKQVVATSRSPATAGKADVGAADNGRPQTAASTAR